MDYNNSQQYNNQQFSNQGVPPQGQPYPGQPMPGQPMPGQPYQGHPYPGPQMPGSIPPDPGYWQWMALEEKKKNRRANIMCLISLFLGIFGAFGVLALDTNFGPLFSAGPDASYFVQELVATGNLFYPFLGSACRIAGLVLMIIVRVKYPKNIFGIVLMIIYILFYVFLIILFVLAAVTFFYLLSLCAGY